MKMRHFFAALAAVFTLGFTVSCDDNNDPTYLDDIKAEQSTVVIAFPNGGSTTATITLKESWTLKAVVTIKVNGKDKIVAAEPSSPNWPSWLTASPVSGSAGTSTITFSAPYSDDGREALIIVDMGDKIVDGETPNYGNYTQQIKVKQGVAGVTKATVAEVLSGPDKTYQVTGVVTKIAETAIYGNFYLNDGTSGTDLYIYGTKYEGETKKAALEKLGIEVGDEVTVEGPKTVYNGTVELVDVDVIKVNKSLLKVESLDPEDGNMPSEGGVITVNLSCKTSNGVSVEIPEDAESWLSIKAIKGTSIVFNVAENTKGPRETTLTFTTTDGKKIYSAEATISQEGLVGTLELPMTVEEAIVAANAGVTKDVYIKGIVSEVLSGGYGAQYGNASFWISADGEKKEDLTLDFEVYQANWLGGNKWTEANAQIEVGAEVIVYGPLTVYKGTAETQGKGAAHVYSVNGVTTDENGIGTLSAPFNCVGGIQAAIAAPASKVYVKGIVSELVNGGFDANYGNGSFWISDDGVKHGDLTLDFEAYQVNYLGGQKWTDADPQIAVGDAVVLYGPLTTYKGTSETQGKGAAYVYSLNEEAPAE